jgi:methyltransferase (TIGR00027 family)
MIVEPDSTAVRVALWRALHVEVDAEPHVLDDTIGLEVAAPGDDWRNRGDMSPDWTSGFRAAVVARARFIEDLVFEHVETGVDQFVLLGAGLDTLAQRRTDLAARLQIFEIDQPGPQAWKQQRLVDLGYRTSSRLHFVPVDFEAGDDWYSLLAAAGFDSNRPALVASTGVSMYLSKDANRQVLERAAGFAPRSTLAMTFMLPAERLEPADRPGLEAAQRGAESSGTPFISFYTPEEMLDAARAAGFRAVEHVAGLSLGDRYFTGRADGLRPSSGEDLLIAGT